MVKSNFTPEVEIRPFRACAMKIRNLTLIYGQIAEIPASYRKSTTIEMLTFLLQMHNNFMET